MTEASSIPEQEYLYNRRKEDKLAVDVALLQQHYEDLQALQEETAKLLTQLLQTQVEEKARKDFRDKILAPIGTLVITIIGAFLGYFIPAYMSKH